MAPGPCPPDRPPAWGSYARDSGSVVGPTSPHAARCAPWSVAAAQRRRVDAAAALADRNASVAGRAGRGTGRGPARLPRRPSPNSARTLAGRAPARSRSKQDRAAGPRQRGMAGWRRRGREGGLLAVAVDLRGVDCGRVCNIPAAGPAGAHRGPVWPGPSFRNRLLAGCCPPSVEGGASGSPVSASRIRQRGAGRGAGTRSSRTGQISLRSLGGASGRERPVPSPRRRPAGSGSPRGTSSDSEARVVSSIWRRGGRAAYARWRFQRCGAVRLLGVSWSCDEWGDCLTLPLKPTGSGRRKEIVGRGRGTDQPAGRLDVTSCRRP